MKILLLTDKMEMGGAETHILTLATALVSLGHEPVVVSSGGSLVRELSNSGIRHVALPLDERTPGAIFCSRAAVARLLRGGRFDIVHSHARIPSLLVCDIAKAARIPLVCTAHAHFSVSPLRRRFSRWGDATIAVSEDIKQYLTEEYFIAPENITVIPNPIDVSRFPARERKSFCKRIAFLSRLDGDCSVGAELLCRIAERLCKRFGRIEIVIGGDGSEYAKIAALAKKANAALGFECVKMCGRIDSVSSFLSSADIFVGVSRAAIEAAVSGVPVVLCGNEGFGGRLTSAKLSRELSTNFCCRGEEKASASRLFSELSSLLCIDESERCSTVSELRTLMLRELDSGICIQKTLDVYSSVVHRVSENADSVLLCGYYGFKNIGDDALLRASVIRAKREFDAPQISALTKNGARDSSVFGIRCVDRYSPLSVYRALKRCDHFIFGGGTLLQDATSRRSLLYYAALLALAKHFGAHCRLWGNGIGELRPGLSRAIAARAISRCEYVGLRDERSLIRAKALSDNPAIRSELDLSSELSSSSDSRAEYLLRRIFGSQAPFQPFVIAAPKRGSGLRELTKALMRVRKEGKEVLTVAMHSSLDRVAVYHICKTCGARQIKGICYSDIVALAKRSGGVYSMRLHALIAAKSAGVAYYAFGNDVKLLDFCRGGQSALAHLSETLHDEVLHSLVK